MVGTQSPPILVIISTPETGEFETPLSNLTTSTAFIETMHAAEFGDAIDIRIGDQMMRAEVVFVADAPMGWVVRFEPNSPLLQYTNPPAIPFNDNAPQVWGEPTPSFQGPPVP
jgi:hypothetical protein